jgi:hypothetical protein
MGRSGAGKEGAQGAEEDDQEDARGAPGGRRRQRDARAWRARVLYGGRQARGAEPPDRGGTREHCAPEVWAREIEETLNDLIPEDAPLLSFGSGADDDLQLRTHN